MLDGEDSTDAGVASDLIECMCDGSELIDAVSAREEVDIVAAPWRETALWNEESPFDSSSGLYPFDWTCTVTALRLSFFV